MNIPRVLLCASVSLAAALLVACGSSQPSPEAADGPMQVWSLPAPSGSGQPDLSVASDGRVLLSWLQTRPGQRTSFAFAEFGDGMWGPAKNIAVGSRFMVNWADTPHVRATPDGALWAQWLQKVDGGGEQGYHVILSTSRDSGVNWSAPARVHTDDSATTHGFVSMWAQSSSELGMAWLDGGSGHMQLRSTGFTAGLRAAGEDSEVLVAERTCECCLTDAAVSAGRATLVWRGLDAQGQRDIYISRQQDGAWSAPALVHTDGWQVDGCPVNGPALAAQGGKLLVGWFTAAQDNPRVQVSLSNDGGQQFAAPVQIASGSAVLGRVEVALDADHVWVLWLQQDNGPQQLMLARYHADLSAEIERVEVARVSESSGNIGMPKMTVRNGEVFVVWTDHSDGASQVRGARYLPSAG